MGLIAQSTPTTTPTKDHPTKRRRFIASSTPYNTSPSSASPSPSLLSHTTTLAPLPSDIERDLLQVGMRVRKAVSDGYPTPQKFTPRPFFNVTRLSPSTQAALMNHPPTTSSHCSGGELDPYAMSKQPISTATFCGVNLHALAEWERKNAGTPKYEYTSSEDEGGMWRYKTSHKRTWEDDEEDVSSFDSDHLPRTPTLDAIPMPAEFFDVEFDDMCDVSPMTQSYHTIPRQQLGQGRKVAQPKSRLRRAEVPISFNPFGRVDVVNEDDGFPEAGFEPQQVREQEQRGHHQRMLSCGMEMNMAMNMAMNMGMAMEFGEPGFLARREDVEMDCS